MVVNRFFDKFYGKSGEVEVSPSFGVCEKSKAELRGMSGESCDSWFVNEKAGFFALFDGAGSRGARRASQIARSACESIVTDNNIPSDSNDLIVMLNVINENLLSDKSAGASTGVLARVFMSKKGPRLDYASIGDSRLYIIRGGRAFQVTKDDSVTNEDLDEMGIFEPEVRQNYLDHGISKNLNSEKFTISKGNSGRLILLESDKIMICSDGITGDISRDEMSEEMIANIVSKNDPERAAGELVSCAKKIDDRTAIVIDVGRVCYN